MNNKHRVAQGFFNRDVLKVAPELIGKTLVRKHPDGKEKRYTITETEAYRGEKDLACHAKKGRTKRTEIMYHEGGCVYMYFIYGMYWMLNFVTGTKNEPQAVLIRGIEGIDGPGKLAKQLQLDRSFYGENLSTSERLWIEDPQTTIEYDSHTRVGIEYAGKPWTEKKWRFRLKQNSNR